VWEMILLKKLFNEFSSTVKVDDGVTGAVPSI
jgi:hypothetical protein